MLTFTALFLRECKEDTQLKTKVGFGLECRPLDPVEGGAPSSKHWDGCVPGCPLKHCRILSFGEFFNAHSLTKCD